MKIVLGCVIIALVGVGAALFALDRAFSGFGEWSHVEVARVPSPSHTVEAVVVESNGGATTSFGYEVYLVSPGKVAKDGVNVANLYGAVRNNHAYGVDLRWTDATHLTVEHWRAKSANLPCARTSIDGNSIAVKIRSGVYNPKAPAGGMGYSLSESQPVSAPKPCPAGRRTYRSRPESWILNPESWFTLARLRSLVSYPMTPQPHPVRVPSDRPCAAFLELPCP